MSVRNSIWVAGVGMIAAVALSGCATKDFVLKQVSASDQKLGARVDETNAKVDVTNAKEDATDRTAREALERAKAAGKLAEGKFLYSVVLSDDSVKFPVNRAELSPEAQARLQEFAEKMKTDNRNVYLEIQGHTDSSGAPAANQRLGLDRAEAVRLFLNKQGVALNRMATISYGPDAPVAPNDTKEGRAQNRRVVIMVLN